MEADSTTYDKNTKTSVDDEPVLPFNTCPGNLKLYKEFITKNGEKTLEFQVVERLQNFGLLPASVSCPSNKPECKLTCRTARVVDKVQWFCEGCGKRQPVRVGSFFLRLQCTIVQALQVILAWCEDADPHAAAEHFGVKPKVTCQIFDKLDDLAIKEYKKCLLGGESSVVLAELYPECLNRLSPDTTDLPHRHRILMLVHTNHIPTYYRLHVLKEDTKKTVNASDSDEALKSQIEEVIASSVVAGSMIVTGQSMPAIDGAYSIQNLVQHCDNDMQNFDFEEGGFVRVGSNGYFLPKFYLEEGAKIYNMQTRPDQVFVGGYPRSGTTWTQQIVWLIVNNLDYEACEKTTMNDKCKYLEIHGVIHETAIFNQVKRLNLNKENIEYLTKQAVLSDEMLKRHNFFKTHLPLSLLPPNLLETSKMVYVARDPRDTIVSLYYLCVGGLWTFKKDFKTMWNLFLKESMYYCPYFEHVKEFWDKRNHPNLLFIFYEDIQNDRHNTLRRVAKFFNKSYTDEQLLQACDYLDFDVLKKKECYNHNDYKKHGVIKPDGEDFIRKGVVGGWREYFDEAMRREAQEWITHNLRDTDLRFPSMQ